MQPFTIQENPHAAHDLVSELMALSVLGVKGTVSVEIVDDRTGRVLAREEAPNYVNTSQWSRFAKAIQKLAWTYGYQGDSTTVTNRTTDARDPRTIPTLRNDIVACWTDTTAEDSTDEFALGEVVAWAHRFQQGSPSTRQGLVQPALCTLTDSAVKWVWEWATGNGNGTFQSVGWRRLAMLANSGDTPIYDLPQLSRRMTAIGTNTVGQVSATTESWTAGPTSTFVALFYNSTDGKFYGLLVAASFLTKLFSSAVTIDAAGNYSTGNFVDESANALAAGLRGNSYATSSGFGHGITRLGAGDWIVVGHSGSAAARRPEIRRVTGAGVVSYTNANGASYAVESTFMDVTYDGTDLFVVARNGNLGTSFIHRINPATGTISATLTVSGLPLYFPAITTAARGFAGIEWDSSRSCLWITTNDGYLFNVDTSGVWGGVLLSDTTNEYPITAATLSGQHNALRMGSLGLLDVDQVQVQFAGGTNQASSQTWPGSQSAQQANPSNPYPSTFRGRLFTMDGSIWAHPDPVGQNSPSFCNANAFEELPAFATRSLLGASVTKNGSQTMRIAYTMTFT